MVRIADIVAHIDECAPWVTAFSGDHVGLQIGEPNTIVQTVAVGLDSSLGAIAFARDSSAQLLVSHHPVIWDPLTEVGQSHSSRRVAALIQAQTAFIAAHTNWDCARGGVNDALAECLGLTDIRPFGSCEPLAMLALHVYVPPDSREALVDALTMAGAGTVGNYRRCVSWSPSSGSFEPQIGASPVIGTVGQRELLPEDRVEMVLGASRRRVVETALRAVHPYEEPAYVFAPFEASGIQIGRSGILPRPMTALELGAHVAQALGTSPMVWPAGEPILETLAVVGGAAGGEWRGADCYLTGEVAHHVSIEASESGTTIIAAGHYATEQPGAAALAQRLRLAFPTLDIRLYVPRPGTSGRPL